MLPETSWKDADKLALARALWRRLDELQPAVVLVPGYYTLPAVAVAVWARLHGRASVLMTESTAGDHARVGWKEWFEIPPDSNAVQLGGGGGCGSCPLHPPTGHAGRARGPFLRRGRQRSDRGEHRAAARDLKTERSISCPPITSCLWGGWRRRKMAPGLLRAWLEYRRQGGGLGAGAGRRWTGGADAAQACSPIRSGQVRRGLRRPEERAGALPLLCPRRGFRSAQHARALGPGRQRGPWPRDFR